MWLLEYCFVHGASARHECVASPHLPLKFFQAWKHIGLAQAIRIFPKCDQLEDAGSLFLPDFRILRNDSSAQCMCKEAFHVWPENHGPVFKFGGHGGRLSCGFTGMGGEMVCVGPVGLACRLGVPLRRLGMALGAPLGSMDHGP